MRLEIIGLEKSPAAFKKSLRAFARFVEKKLVERKILPSPSQKKLSLAFLSSKKMLSLNKKFLGKSRATDVLSFSPVEKGSFGELALCMKKIKAQAKAHKLSAEEETAYLVLHGFLHLLGYHHEGGGPAAKKMLKIQDEIFNQWLSSR